MTNKEKAQKYCDENNIEEPIELCESPSYEGALIGFSVQCNKAIYSYEKMVQSLMETDKISREEAEEFIDYNFIGFNLTNIIIMREIEA